MSTSRQLVTPIRHLVALVLLFALAAAPAARAQVSLEIAAGRVTITNTGYAPQSLVHTSSKAGDGAWWVADNVGNYYAADGGGDAEKKRPTNVPPGGKSNGNSVGGSGSTINPPIIIIGGYESVLGLLQQRFGLGITEDTTLGATLLTLQRQEDVDPFFDALVNDSLDGYPLYQYFQHLEIVSQGTFDEPEYAYAKTSYKPLPFPNDPLYWEQWGLMKTRLALAQWHPALAHKRVRIAVIDSGVGSDEQANGGLDGVAVEHVAVAPSSGRPVPHALGLLTLMGDRSHDGSGIIGMVGNWGADGCYANPPLFQNTTPELISYNVGDFGPVSIYVARAIRLAVERGVDVINLSMRIGYSPLVEAAIQEALAANVIVVAAAGNYDAAATDKPATFPANMDGVISVGAANEAMDFAGFSARTGVDILAPGEHIVVGGPHDIWYYGDGTSYAAPFVTATVAMMRSIRPELTPTEVVSILQERARDRNRTGVGVVNALSSVNAMITDSERVRYLMMPHECAIGAWLGKDGVDAVPFVDDYDDAQDDDLFARVAAAPGVPDATGLDAPYPNPFAGETHLNLRLAAPQRARVALYDALGRQVRLLLDETRAEGTYPLTLDAGGLPSGLYFVRLETGGRVHTQPVTLVR